MTSRKALSVSEMDACLAGWRLFHSCRNIFKYAQNKLRPVGTQTQTYALTLSRIDKLFFTLKLFWAICRVRNDMRLQS